MIQSEWRFQSRDKGNKPHDVIHCTKWKSTLFINFLVSQKYETEIEGIHGRKDVEPGKWRDSPVLTPQCEGEKKRKQTKKRHSDDHKLKFYVISIIPDHKGCNYWHTVTQRWEKKNLYSRLRCSLEFQKNVSVVQSWSHISYTFRAVFEWFVTWTLLHTSQKWCWT